MHSVQIASMIKEIASNSRGNGEKPDRNNHGDTVPIRSSVPTVASSAVQTADKYPKEFVKGYISISPFSDVDKL